MKVLNFRSLIIFSAFLRALLIVYGEWQDTHMEVRYTDVDYLVFSNAAALVVAGKSPYKRSTYRYSPLIAYILAPNSFIQRSWGKFLFSVSGNIFQGAVWYGLVVHMRIYPIIYDIPIILILDPNHYRPGKKPSIIAWNSRQPKPNAILGSTKFFDLNRIFTRSRILFGLILAIIFFFFTGIFFYHYK
ncbi:hypothetical protein R6Q59_013266 [Mikania micrantha]